MPELEQQLAELEKKKKTLPRKNQSNSKICAMQSTKPRPGSADARISGPAQTFSIRDGEAFANANTPPQSFYELMANANFPVVTAIRVAVPPVDAEKARHTPEYGFIVDKVQTWLIEPDGKRNKSVSATLSRIQNRIWRRPFPWQRPEAEAENA